MKKLWLNIVIFFNYLMRGLRSADNLLATSEKNDADGSRIEQQNEQNSVYADLLKGEVTQEVKELRHEMYYAERESHKYSYNGGGTAKKNMVFDFNGNIYTGDGLKVQIVQENKETPSTLMENGIYCVGEHFDLSETAKRDLGTKDRRDFTIFIDRDFSPKFRLEKYATKIVVKRIDETRALLDVYVSQYPKQFDNISKLFVNEVDKIYQGFVRSDVIDFNNLSFITSNAYGSDDLKLYRYHDVKFDTINKFDGSYVLSFISSIEHDGYDLIAEFYDESAAKKNAEHAPRESAATVSLDVAQAEIDENNFDAETALNLMKVLDESKN